MSRRRSSTYFPPPPLPAPPPPDSFPDEEEIFEPFDQHRILPTIQDSLKLKKNSTQSSIRQSINSQRQQSEADNDNDPARVSRLFYLQLYSSVLNAAKEEEEAKKKVSSVSRTQKLLNTLLRTKPEAHPQLQRNSSEDFEREAGETSRESIVLETITHPEVMNRSSSRRYSVRSQHPQPPPIPVLNTRMKNLSSQFSFKYRQNQLEDRKTEELRRIEEQQRPRAKRSERKFSGKICFQSVFFSVLLLCIILVLAVVLSSPQAMSSYYDVAYLPDVKSSVRPSLAFCWPMPFHERKLRDLSVTSELASFLLYTLSPYYPNPDILDKPDLLTDLTRQFRSYVSRSSRRNSRFRNETEVPDLQSLLHDLASVCSELIVGCQTGSGAIIRGLQCCRLFFEDKLVFSPDGFCLVGGGKQLALLSSDPKFPIAPRPFSMAKLTIVLNMTARMPIDHRVVPWEPANEDIMTVSVIEEGKTPAFRDIENDFVVRPGHLVSVLAEKRQILRSESKLLPSSCRPNYDSIACKSSVVQMIAEKSVNCSLISLPKSIDKKELLPNCGPLEGLALMYVLREQGALVTVNSSMLQRFESTLTGHCPQECEEQFFKPLITSDTEIDSRMANTFGVYRAQDIAVLEIRYNTKPFIHTLRFKPGPLVSLERVGIVTGATSLLLLIIILVSRISKQRRRAFFI